MKKLAITLAAALIGSMMSVSAQTTDRMVPVGCPVKQPCPVVEPCEKPCAPVCECPEEDLCAMKQKFLDERSALYRKLCLSANQITQAKCIDEKYFAEIHPLKEYCKKEKSKLKDMECKKACEADIKAQKSKVKDLKNQIKEKKKAYKEAFMCILNECQKKEYKKMKKEKCKEPKKAECDCDCK